MNVKNSSQNTVKKYEELTFTDDFMFCKVMQNNPDLCKHLIELIIGKKITIITYPDTQKAIEITADGKGIRMDVYVEGDEGTIYDIEMQTLMLSNLNKRARYYQGMIDLNTIERGADYKELRKTYIIFLCKFDPFGQARIKYTFMQTCQEDYRINLGDDAYIIYINPFGMKENPTEDMIALMSYLRGEMIKRNSFIEDLDAAVKRAREKEDWKVEYMALSLKFQDAMEEGRAEGRAEMQQNIVIKLLSANQFSDKEICSIVDISEEKLEEYKKCIWTKRKKNSIHDAARRKISGLLQ